MIRRAGQYSRVILSNTGINREGRPEVYRTAARRSFKVAACDKQTNFAIRAPGPQDQVSFLCHGMELLDFTPGLLRSSQMSRG